MRWTPRSAALLVGVVAFLAYVPVLDGEFLELDDGRFVRDNPAVHRLDPGQAVRYFTDPETLATRDWQGTYRPLRTLEFSIDWAVSGGRPWFFHLRNVLYHVLGSVLVLALFRRLEPEEGVGRAPVLGALLFAVHPVQTEAVAWISTRADTMLLVTFLGALLLHVSGRRVLAALVLVISLFSKESAAVFFAVAFLVDHARGGILRWRWYGLYAVLGGLFVLLWLRIQGQGLGHHAVWWGDGYGDNLLTVLRGQVHYAGLVVLPVRQALDYWVPATSGLDIGAVLGTLLVLGAAAGAWRGGRHVRLAVLWFAVTLLPVSNLFFTVAAPTTERFLYLPLVGLCFLGGRLLARAPLRLAFIPLLCLLLLTLHRVRDWKDHDRLMGATRDVALTQVGQQHLAKQELRKSEEAHQRGDRDGMLRHARTMVRVYADLFDSYWKRFHRGPSVDGLLDVSAGLFVLGEYEESLRAARKALSEGGYDAVAHYNAGAALARLGREEESAWHTEQAIEAGYDRTDLRPIGARLLNAAARKRVRAREFEKARELYRRSLLLLGDLRTKEYAEAREGLRRLPR